MNNTKIVIVLFSLCFHLSSVGQVRDELASVDQLVREIGALRAADLTQIASRSRIEACALKVKFGYPTDDPPGEEIMMLLISNLDANKIDVDFNEDNEEWDLTVYCNDLQRHVLVADKDFGDSYENLLMISDKNKDVLIKLKETLITAIRECQARE